MEATMTVGPIYQKTYDEGQIWDPESVKKEFVPPEGAVEITVEEAYELIEKSIHWAFNKFPSMRRDFPEVDDLKNGILVHFITKNYLKRFKPSITSPKYFISTGIKHFCISYIAKKRVSEVSAEIENEDGESLSLIDLLGVEAKNGLAEFFIEECFEVLNDEFLRKKGVWESPIEGEILFTERKAFEHYVLYGMTYTEIANIFRVTRSCIRQIIMKAIEKIREQVSFDDLGQEIKAVCTVHSAHTL